MAKAVYLGGGSKGTKNTNHLSASAQKPYKSKPVNTREAGTVNGGRKAIVAGKNNPKSGASDIHSVTVPEMPHKNAKSFWLKWMAKRGATIGHTLPNASATSSPADMVGTSRTSNKNTKKTTPVSNGKHGKVTYQARAAKARKRPTVLGA